MVWGAGSITALSGSPPAFISGAATVAAGTVVTVPAKCVFHAPCAQLLNVVRSNFVTVNGTLIVEGTLVLEAGSTLVATTVLGQCSGGGGGVHVVDGLGCAVTGSLSMTMTVLQRCHRRCC